MVLIMIKDKLFYISLIIIYIIFLSKDSIIGLFNKEDINLCSTNYYQAEYHNLSKLLDIKPQDLDIEIFGNKIHISDIISRISNHNYGLELLNYLLLLTQEIMTVNKISIIYGELVEKDYTRWSQLYYIYNKLVSVNVSNISLHCFFDEEKLQSNSQRYVCDVSFGYILS